MKGFLIVAVYIVVSTSLFASESVAQEDAGVLDIAEEPEPPGDPDCGAEIPRGVRPKPDWVPKSSSDWGWAKNCETGTELNFFFVFNNRKIYFIDNGHKFIFPDKISVLNDRCTLTRIRGKGDVIVYRVRTNKKFNDASRLMTLYINALLKGAWDIIHKNRLEKFMFHSKR